MDEQRWYDTLYGKLSEGEVQGLLAETVGELNDRLREEPSLQSITQKILERSLAEPVMSQRWDRLVEGLSGIWGKGFAYLIGWLSDDPEQRMNQVNTQGELSIKVFLGEVIGVFGPEIRRSLDAATRLPDDWWNAKWQVFAERTGGEYRIRFELSKFNGQHAMWETTPDGLLRLMTYLSEAVAAVGEREAFSDSAIEGLKASAPPLDTMFGPHSSRGQSGEGNL